MAISGMKLADQHKTKPYPDDSPKQFMKISDIDQITAIKKRLDSMSAFRTEMEKHTYVQLSVPGAIVNLSKHTMVPVINMEMAIHREQLKAMGFEA